MELLTNEEINLIAKQFGQCEVVNWTLQDFSNKIMGYLGDHLKLTIQVKAKGGISELFFFVKCMPKDPWKAQYIKELTFFNKESVMLSQLFSKFDNPSGYRKWRPNLLFLRENLFVFEDVKEIGYVMPSNVETMTLDQMTATVEALARFHAQSYIYEEKKSEQFNRPYRIWEDYSEYLQEPLKSDSWRVAGQNAIIDFLKIHSNYKDKPNFIKIVKASLPMLFNKAENLMKPHAIYRNAVIHRDIWSNNVFLKKKGNENYHALIIDFQTVLYAMPMADLSSLIYFNTTKIFRENYTNRLINLYYDTLAEELRNVNLDINIIYDKMSLLQSYEESKLFGITQAALIVPIIAMSGRKREIIFSNPETSRNFSIVSRSDEFLSSAKEDERYRDRISELFDEIVDRYVYSQSVSLK
ncbi:uncharacterized protein ACR2FA_000620 [Aphomia sociella]